MVESPPDVAHPRPGLLIAALALVALTVAVLQTAVVPVLGTIADQLNASPVAVSWAVTANLLAAAAATPLIGRLADLHNKKHVLLGVLVIVLVGSILAATTSSLALLIVARVLQGVSFALYPVCVAVLREELADDAPSSYGSHHMLKTFWPGWSNRQDPDGTIVWTDPDGNTITTHPGSRLLFPELCQPTADVVTRGNPPPKHTAGLTMPRRKTTRSHARRQRTDDDRRANIPLVAQRLRGCFIPF